MEEKDKIKLEELLESLSKIRGRHTELISVYVPSGFDLNSVAKQLDQEKGTAVNIKSKSTRKNVLDALERITRQLKLIPKTPENGLAVFAGNVSDKEGQVDIQIWTIEPPMPMVTRLYRCDQTFVLEPLSEMLEVSEVYGLLVLDRKEAAIGLLEGKMIKVLRKMTSGVPGKVRAGGQCLSPDTLVETKEGNKKISEIALGDEIKAFDFESKKIVFTRCINKWEKRKRGVRQIDMDDDSWKIISSRDHTFFIEEDNKFKEIVAGKLFPLDCLITNKSDKIETLEIFDLYDYLEKEIDMIDIETEIKNFFANNILVHNSSQRFHRITEGLAKEFYRRIAEAVKEEFFHLKKLKGLLIGGPVPTKEDFLKEGELVTALKEKVIAVKDLGYADEHGLELLVEASQEELAQQEMVREKQIIERFFTTLAKEASKSAYGLQEVKKALSYGAVETLLLSKKLKKNLINELREEAENTGASIEYISTDNTDGEQFDNLGGIGAILRFPI